jgi:uncharacterized membrane protein HdeD (DUF308 family)
MLADDLRTVYRQSLWVLVLRGLFALALGVYILAQPMESVAALALVIAIWALFDGFASIVRAFSVRRVARHWWVMALSGGVSAAFGIAALYDYPALPLSFAVLWTSLWLLTGGAMGVFSALQERAAGLPWGWTMAFGVLTVAAGTLAWVYPAITLASLMGVIAAFGIAGGTAMLAAAWKLHAIEHDVARIVGAARA